MNPSLVPGATLPDLELPDHTGITRTLTELAAGDPLLLVLYRGYWCPKEQTYRRMLVGLQEEAEVGYGRFVSLSVDEPAVSAAFRAGLQARWTFLSDTERRYMAELDLRKTTDTVHDPYVSTAFTLFPDLRIHRVFNGYWYWGRPTPEEIRQDFRAVTREIRPDWEVG